MNRLYVPADIQCFWCNGHMRQKGVTCMGSGLNCVSYFCKDCGGIAHFARHDNKYIEDFTTKYNFTEEKKSNETTIGHWLDGSDDLPPIGGFHD